MEKKNEKISFFKFLLDIPNLLERWIAAIGRKNWTPTSGNRICQIHFNDTDFSKTSKVKRLKADIIPTQNLYQSSNEDSNPNDCNVNLEILHEVDTASTAQCNISDVMHMMQPGLRISKISSYRYITKNKHKIL